jgi:hypothetical protein
MHRSSGGRVGWEGVVCLACQLEGPVGWLQLYNLLGQRQPASPWARRNRRRAQRGQPAREVTEQEDQVDVLDQLLLADRKHMVPASQLAEHLTRHGLPNPNSRVKAWHKQALNCLTRLLNGTPTSR